MMQVVCLLLSTVSTFEMHEMWGRKWGIYIIEPPSFQLPATKWVIVLRGSKDLHPVWARTSGVNLNGFSLIHPRNVDQ